MLQGFGRAIVKNISEAGVKGRIVTRNVSQFLSHFFFWQGSLVGKSSPNSRNCSNDIYIYIYIYIARFAQIYWVYPSPTNSQT